MKLRKPSDKQDIWIHFDSHRKDRKVWAVQFYCKKTRKWKYITSKYVSFQDIYATTRYFEGEVQPRAVINVWKASVVISKNWVTIGRL